MRHLTMIAVVLPCFVFPAIAAQDTSSQFKAVNELQERVSELTDEVREMEAMLGYVKSGYGPARVEEIGQSAFDRARKASSEAVTQAAERSKSILEKADGECRAIRDQARDKMAKFQKDLQEDIQSKTAAANHAEQQMSQYHFKSVKYTRFKKKAEKLREEIEELRNGMAEEIEKARKRYEDAAEKEAAKAESKAQREAQGVVSKAKEEGEKGIKAGERTLKKMKEMAARMREEGVPEKAGSAADEATFAAFAKRIEQDLDRTRSDLDTAQYKLAEAKKKLIEMMKKRAQDE